MADDVQDQIKAHKKRAKKVQTPPEELKVEFGEVDRDANRVTNKEYHYVFQDDKIGQRVFSELYMMFVNGKQFDKDPYQHAFNAGKAAVVNYMLARCRAENAPQVKENVRDFD